MDVVTTAIAVVRDRQLTFIAGALAYAAFLSLVPLLVLFLTLTAVLRGDGLAAPLLEFVETQFSAPMADVLRHALQHEQRLLGASAIGVVVFVWSGMRIFRGLNVAFGAIYGESESSFVATVRDGTLAMGCLVVAVGLLVVAEAAVAAYVDSVLVSILAPALLVGGLAVALVPVYYVLPDVPVTLREAVPGAIVTALGWLVLGAVFQVYVAATGRGAGILGAIIILLTLLYLAMLVFLVGGVVNAVLGGRDVAGPSTELTALG